MTDDTLQEEEFQGNLNVALWRRMLRHLRPYWKCALGVVGVGGIVAACDAGLTLLTRNVIDEAVGRGPRADLVPYGLAYAGLAVTLCVAVFGFINLAGRITTHVSHDIRRAGFAKLQELSFSYYDRRPVGWLMARLTSDCERLSQLMGWGLLDMVWGSAFLATVAVILIVIHWQVA
jgi:ATP-binding cassette subfamily B protein